MSAGREVEAEADKELEHRPICDEPSCCCPVSADYHGGGIPRLSTMPDDMLDICKPQPPYVFLFKCIELCHYNAGNKIPNYGWECKRRNQHLILNHKRKNLTFNPPTLLLIPKPSHPVQ
jgi:hypothetical protein